MWLNYLGAKYLGKACKLKQRKENSPSCVYVLHKTWNFVISRCCQLQRTAKKCTERTHVRAIVRLITEIQPFCDVLVAVAVVRSIIGTLRYEDGTV